MSNYKNLINVKNYKGIYGAVIGDIYGSYYEFKRGPKTPKQYIQIHDSSRFTDDSILTVAVADFLAHKDEGKPCSYYLQKWTRKYPDAGYGGRFATWIYKDDPQPYNSCGNGSAMRVSAVPYLASSIEECEKLAIEVTKCTHNHPEGIKGAVVIATCIYMALHAATRDEIREYAKQYYDLNLDYDAMMAELDHGEEICQVTVPQALWCFLHSDSFDDCLRLCLSIRWDADTMAAIACPIAEAYYKEIPEECLIEAKKRLPEEIKAVLESVRKE